MKVLKIILYALLTLLVVTTLFINISPQFGSNPSRSQRQFFSSFKNFENGEFKNNEPTALFTDEMSFWDFFKTDLNRVPIKEIIPLNVDVESFVNADGFVEMPTEQDFLREREGLMMNSGGSRAGNWSLVGPLVAYNTSGNPVSLLFLTFGEANILMDRVA